jgi:hypothetical protein
MFTRSRLALLGAITLATSLCTALAPVAHAGLLPPKRIDANTGQGPTEVGASVSAHRAWAGFIQRTGGVERLYVDYAQNNRWAHPFLVDGGKAVAGAGLAGSAGGSAVVVFLRLVNGNGILFGRRLHGGTAGPIEQISANGQNASFPGELPFVRGRAVAENRAGAAAVCYPSGNQNEIATLAAGSNKWVNHAAASSCTDMAIDQRGDVISVSLNGPAFVATRIVAGQVHDDTFGSKLMDEESVALSPTGMAIAIARDQNFDVVGYELPDIAHTTPWQSLGRIDSNNVFDQGDSPEEPRAAIDRNGNGIVVWHSNSQNDAKTAYAAIVHGQPKPATFLSKEFVDSFPYAAIIRPGMPAVSFELTNRAIPTQSDNALFRFSGATPGPPALLAPGMAPTNLSSAAGFVSDGVGDTLSLLYQGANPPQHLIAVLGHFA